MVNPFYINSQNNIIYFENIEEYAKYIGLDWAGIGLWGDYTIVNNLDEYYTVI
jgi:hypothetical protein